MQRHALRVLYTLTLLAIAGCGETARKTQHMASAPSDVRGEAMPPPGASGEQTKSISSTEGMAAESAPPPGANRKIIFRARIDVVVENFDNIPARLAELVKKSDGYVADSTLSGSTGRNRSGTWKIRVPVVRFDEFVNQAKGIGELISANTQSQDVSEEYYDVDARIRNKTKEEERLLKLLDDRPAKLEEVLTVERELSRVRDEIERMQGRMRVLTDQTSLTTVEITIREMQNYEPPQSPTFLTRVGRAFLSSTSGIKSTFEWFLILIAKLIPWLFAIALAIWLFFAVLRIAGRRR